MDAACIFLGNTLEARAMVEGNMGPSAKPMKIMANKVVSHIAKVYIKTSLTCIVHDQIVYPPDDKAQYGGHDREKADHTFYAIFFSHEAENDTTCSKTKPVAGNDLTYLDWVTIATFGEVGIAPAADSDLGTNINEDISSSKEGHRVHDGAANEATILLWLRKAAVHGWCGRRTAVALDVVVLSLQQAFAFLNLVLRVICAVDRVIAQTDENGGEVDESKDGHDGIHSTPGDIMCE